MTSKQAGLARLQKWGRACRWRLNNDYDAVNVFTGPEGVGKSTLSYQVAYLIDPTFRAEDRTAFGTDQALQIANQLDNPEGRCIEIDEGVEGLLNRDAMSTDNKRWQKFMIICRKQNLAVNVCFPRLRSMDLYMREFRVWTWFQVRSRGKAWVRVRNWDVSPEKDDERLLEAFPVVAKIQFPKIDEFAKEIVDNRWLIDDWEEKKKKNERYIQEFMDESN